jgi:O-antigen ligase
MIDIKQGLILVILIITAVLIIIDVLKKKLEFKRYIFFVWYAVFFAYCCLSLIWTMDSDLSKLWLDGMLPNVGMLLAVVHYVNSRERFYRLIKLQLIAIFYMCVRLLILMPERHLFGRGRTEVYIWEISGFHYNGLAIPLTAGIILTVFFYIKNKKPLVLFLAPLFYLTIIIGGSRQGVVIPIVGLFVIFALLNGIKGIRRTIITSAVIVILFILFINSGLPGADRMSALVKGFIGNTAEAGFSFNERVFQRGLAAEMFLQKPILGWGIYSFTAKLIEIEHHTIFAYCHNTYLELLSCLGIIGFVIYYSIYAGILFKAFKLFKTLNIYVIFALAACIVLLLFEYATVMFYPIHGLTGTTFLFYAYYSLKLADNKKDLKCQEEKVSQPDGS